MSEPRTIHIVHLYRKDGRSMFLHPFSADEESVDRFLSGRMHGLYGEEPPISALNEFRNELYLIGERGLRRWNAEDRFILRFLISSGLFVLVFLFLSVVVRDPVPLLDELLISLVVSIAAYYALVRRDLASQRVERRRIEIRSAIDRTVFDESGLVHRLEETLHAQESTDVPILEPEALMVEERDADTAAELLSYLEARFRTRRSRREERRLMRAAGRAGERNDSGTRARRAAVDVPLLCLYVILKRRVGR